MSKTRRGFTLIELLVVIAIILILAAILFPVFAKVRGKAYQTTCINQLKQMGTAAHLYENAYEGVIMPTCAIWEIRPQEYETKWWPELLDLYLKQMAGRLYAGGTGKLFKCPSVTCSPE